LEEVKAGLELTKTRDTLLAKERVKKMRLKRKLKQRA
jgi:hypothetical protein